MERPSRVLYHEKSKNLSECAAIMFCKQFLAYTVHIGWCNP